MKLLFTHRFFWPDTPPYALMLRDIADRFAEAGHEVHVFASRPSYRAEGSADAPRKERMGALNVQRCFAFQAEKQSPLRRVVNVLVYCLALMLRILVLRPDVVTASTFPPVAAGWCASLASRLVGARFVYHMQDIHPEVSVYSGGAMGRGIVRRIFTAMDNQTLRRSWAIVVLSEDMAETLRARGIADLPIHVINNFELSSSDAGAASPASKYPKPPGTVRVIFAGNLGTFQNLPMLAEGVAACFPKHDNLELFFLGSGTAEAGLKADWEDDPQVQFAPFLPFDEAKQIIEGADIGLVSLSPNLYRVAYPSKVQTYRGLGLPMLLVVEPESDLARTVTDMGLGEVPKAATVEGIAEAVGVLLQDLERYKAHAAEGRDLVTFAHAAKAWDRLLNEREGAQS